MMRVATVFSRLCFLRGLACLSATCLIGLPGLATAQSDPPQGTGPLKDIQGGVRNSNPEEITDLHGVVFFRANDGLAIPGGVGGPALWKSDGTPTGTVRVRPGRDAEFPDDLTVVGSRLFFSGSTDGRELWVTDGTEAGTTPLPIPNRLGLTSPNADELTAVGCVLYFVATGDKGRVLYKYDEQTGQGPSMVAIIDPNFPDDPEYVRNPKKLTKVGDDLFLVANDGSGNELWTTKNGPHRVVDIWPGALGSEPHALTDFHGRCWFSAVDLQHGRELWMSDGLNDSVMVKDLNPGITDTDPDHLTVAGDLLYFTVASVDPNNQPLPRRLFATAGFDSQGRLSSLKEISNIPSNPLDPKPLQDPDELVAAGDRLYFTGFEEGHGRDVWVTRGVDQSAVRVVDLSSNTDSPSGLTPIGSRYLWFAAQSGTASGKELYRIHRERTPLDGTFNDGIFELRLDVWPGPQNGFPGPVTLSNGTLFFAASFPGTGRELWSIAADGTTQRGGSPVGGPGRTPSLDSTDGVMGEDTKIRGDDAPLGSNTLLYIGLPASSPVPVGGKMFSGASLHTLVLIQILVDNQKTWETVIRIPNNPSLLGKNFIFQSLSFPSDSPAGFDLSNWIKLTTGH